MSEIKGWDWQQLADGRLDHIWKEPSIESYYLVNRWYKQGKSTFLDLGCGLGRHAILFGKNNYKVFCFDISEYAIEKTKEWAESLDLHFDYRIGNMIEMPYDNETFDCIYAKNVISHTDTIGVKKIALELYRILKPLGECYLTLSSKEVWKYKTQDWPLIDNNTKLKMDEGPEYKVPHFYIDYDMINDIFNSFEIIKINHVEEYFLKDNEINKAYHYHVLLRKNN